MPLSDALRKVKGFLVESEDENLPVSSTPFPTPPGQSSPGQNSPGQTASGVSTPAPAPKATKTLEQIAREQPGPSLDEIKAPAAPTAPAERPDGTIDFNAIYGMAGLAPTPFTAEQALEILASLPAELPMATKRATMKVTLNAMGAALGVTPETVVADASRKLTALGAFAAHFTEDATAYATRAEAEIARHEAEIAQLRERIASAQARQVRMVEACDQEADRLDDVLEFFSLDAGSSKHAPIAG